MVAHTSIMPGIMIERPKMTRVMYQSLKRHIMKEREKIRQEQEQDEAMERFRKEKELEKKKKEEDSLTLEQTKEQIASLETKLESLKQEKHKLFSQLKKVLHQEDENRKRAQLKEHNEIMSLQQHYQTGMPVGHPMQFMQTHMQQRPKQYMNVPMHQQVVQQQSLKRPRSPSPPPPAPAATIYPHQHYPGGKYPPVSYPPTSVKQEPHYTGQQHKKAATYPVSSHASYTSQTPHTYQVSHTQSQPQQQAPPQQAASYPTNQSPAGKYAATNPSAFQSYPNHYAQHQKGIPEHYQQAGYPVTRVAQPGNIKGYIGSPHGASNLPLQQQLEHANQKSGFSEDKFKMQQVKQMRNMAPMPAQQPSIIQGQMPSSQASSQPPPPPKGSIMSGYPVRTQAATSQIQVSAAAPSSHTSPGPPRIYNSADRGRYY